MPLPVLPFQRVERLGSALRGPGKGGLSPLGDRETRCCVGRYVGTIVFFRQKVLLVRDRDDFTGLTLWTWPSGGVEDGESPATAAAREIAEESGCRIDPSALELIATSEVRQHGRRLSHSWNYTATTTDARLEPADPHGTVDEARWFERAEAAELLTRHRYDPIREPALRFLRGGDRGLHWTFDLAAHAGQGPVFTWQPPIRSTTAR